MRASLCTKATNATKAAATPPPPPLMMRAVVLNSPGGTENLAVSSLAVPAVGPGQVRVRVHACGVCHRDILDRKGSFPFISRPAVLGHEIAGVVEEVGAGVERLKVGDKVVSLHWASCGACPACLRGESTDCERAWSSFLGLTTFGGYAEYCVVGESCWVKVSGGFSASEAATLVCTYGTVWHGAVTRGQLKEGERILVTGASGGVGTAMLQIAKALNCKTFAVTSEEAKTDYLLANGADKVIVAKRGEAFHKHPDLVDVPMDMAFEAVGAPTFSSSLRSLRPGGRLVLIGNVTNASVTLPLGMPIVKGLSIIGSDSCTQAEMDQVFSFMEKHGIKPNIEAVVPLDQAAECHTKLETKPGVTGRLVLGIANEQW